MPAVARLYRPTRRQRPGPWVVLKPRLRCRRSAPAPSSGTLAARHQGRRSHHRDRHRHQRGVGACRTARLVGLRLVDVRRRPRRRRIEPAPRCLALLVGHRAPHRHRLVQQVEGALRRRHPARREAHVAHELVAQVELAPRVRIRQRVVGPVAVLRREQVGHQLVARVVDKGGVQETHHRRRRLAAQHERHDQRIDLERSSPPVQVLGEAVQVDRRAQELEHHDRQAQVLGALEGDDPHTLVEVAAQRRCAGALDRRVRVHHAHDLVRVAWDDGAHRRERRHARRLQQPLLEALEGGDPVVRQHDPFVQPDARVTRRVGDLVDRVHLRVRQREQDHQVVQHAHEPHVLREDEDALDRSRQAPERRVHLRRRHVADGACRQDVAADEARRHAHRPFLLRRHEQVDAPWPEDLFVQDHIARRRLDAQAEGDEVVGVAEAEEAACLVAACLRRQRAPPLAALAEARMPRLELAPEGLLGLRELARQVGGHFRQRALGPVA